MECPVRLGILCLLYLLLITHGSEQTRYVVPILGVSSDVTLQLGVTNPGYAYTIDVTATYFQHNQTEITVATTNNVDTTNPLTLEILEENTLNGSIIANTSLVVESTGYFELQVISKLPNGHSEGFRALSTDVIGNEYFVSTFCALGGYCQIAIAAVETGMTQVFIGLPNNTDEIVLCMGTQTWRSLNHTTVNLTYPQVLQVETMHDLTGTHIYTDQAVSVVVGTRSMPGGDLALFHFSEQLVPVTEWGTEFVLIGLFTGYGSIVHITASVKNTVVEISGFRHSSVKIPSRGQTIRRRLEDGVTCYVKSNKPVQVMMYHGTSYLSNETMTSVSMTLAPAVEHFELSYVATCPFTSETFYQYVTYFGVSMTGTWIQNITSIPFTEYEVRTEIVTQSTFQLQVSTTVGTEFRYIGGIMMCGTAMFPLGTMINYAQQAACVSTINVGYPGDDVDNDCDGSVDEDSCYENIRVISTFDQDNSSVVPMYTITATGFQLIKLRVQSCGISHVEFHDTAMRRFLVQLSSAKMTMFKCNSGGCVVRDWMDTSNMLVRDCLRDVVFYWFLQVDGEFCVGVGPVVPTNCTYEMLVSTLPTDLSEMRLSGTLSSATFWYDIYGSDCGKLESDWRCDDQVTNCHEYTDLCGNIIYTAWVEINCPKFCGVCAPDSFGKMFAIPVAVVESDIINLLFVGTDGTDGNIGIMSSDLSVTTSLSNIDNYDNFTLASCATQRLMNDMNYYIFSDGITAIYLNMFSTYTNVATNLLLPYDALGNEYMTLTFADITDTLKCNVIPHDGELDLWLFRKQGSKLLERNLNNYTMALNNGDQTGTVIKSRSGKPFAVFCGTGNDTVYGSSLNQLPPVNTWGTFHVTPAATTSELTKLKIVTNSANTVIEINGDFDAVYVLYERGDALEIDISSATSYNITSSHPVLVGIMHYLGGLTIPSSFHFIPASSNFAAEPVLHSLTTAHNAPSVLESLTVTDDAGNIVTTLLPGLANAVSYFYTDNVTDSNTFCLAFMYVLGKIKVVPSTVLFKDFTQERICALGDNGDADCDGLVDEEPVCYTGYGTTKYDLDLDGAFSEDCLDTSIGESNMSAPTEPVCLIVTKNKDSYCWQPCMCRCSWTNSMATYDTMTPEEQGTYNIEEVREYLEDLAIDHDKLLSATSQKESAPDERQSSAQIGVVGIVVLVVSFGVIVMFDAITLVKYVRGLFIRSGD